MAMLQEQARRYPDLDLTPLDTSGLEARDAALAHAIYDAVIRRWITLEHLIGASLDKSWELAPPRVKAAMLAGAAQLVLLDRVPAHAAVHESVEWVKGPLGPRAAGLVNAVLRRTAELAGEPERTRRPQWNDLPDEVPLSDGTAVVLTRGCMPADPLERLAIATSHPIELLRTLSRSMPMRDVRRIALHNLLAPPVILNTLHAQSDLPEGLIPHTAPGHHVYTGEHADLGRMLRSRKDIWVQDPASALAVQTVADLKPALVIDPCAGMGTKTRQLAATFPRARIIATDIDLPRRHELERVFAGHDRVEVVPFKSLREFVGQADLILLDVPCSNSGVLARRPEARYRFDDKRTESLSATQRQIVADSIPLLRPGSGKGRILYSTCSLDPRENEEMARWASRWHGLNAAREHRRLPEGVPGDPPERYSDGSFAVLLE